MVKKYGLRTDFCDEMLVNKHSDDTLHYTKKVCDSYIVTSISILKEENILQKDIGEYITIDFENIYDLKNRKAISACVCNCLKQISPKGFHKVLVIGLGNNNAVSDALGPQTCDKVMVTSHYFMLHKQMPLQGCSNVGVFVPKVMGQTGMESAHLCKLVTAYFKPDLVLVIDALATSSRKRINSAIQMNNVGINPGSGVNNKREAINEQSLGCPVISLGVATVSSLYALIKDVFEEATFPYDIIKKDADLDLIVTPKNMDEDVMYLSGILADGINRFLHPDFEQL